MKAVLGAGGWFMALCEWTFIFHQRTEFGSLDTLMLLIFRVRGSGHPLTYTHAHKYTPDELFFVLIESRSTIVLPGGRKKKCTDYSPDTLPPTG